MLGDLYVPDQTIKTEVTDGTVIAKVVSYDPNWHCGVGYGIAKVIRRLSRAKYARRDCLPPGTTIIFTSLDTITCPDEK